MHVLAVIQLHLIWFYSSSVRVGEMVDKSNSTTNRSIHLFSITAFYNSKRITMSEHHYQLVLPSWEIKLLKLHPWQTPTGLWRLNSPWYQPRLFCPRSCSCIFAGVVLSPHYSVIPWKLHSSSVCGTLEIHGYHHSDTTLGAQVHRFGAVHWSEYVSFSQSRGREYVELKSCQKYRKSLTEKAQ